MLFTMQEIQAVLQLFNRAPVTLAEQLYAKDFFERLATFCRPPKPGSVPEPEPPDSPKPKEPYQGHTSE